MDIAYPETDILRAFDDERSPSVRTSISGGTLREPTTARALHISIPERRGVTGPDALTTATAGEGQEIGVGGDRSDDAVDVAEGDIGQMDSSETGPSRSPRTKSSDSPEASSAAQLPASPEIIMPRSARAPSTRLQERSSLASPGLAAFPQSTSPSPGRESGGQNPFSYDYVESPRSPLQWRQTFEEAVRASSSGYLSPVVGSLSHTPTPAPASYEGRKDSVGPDGYFTSRRGSQVDLERRQSVTSPQHRENGREDSSVATGQAKIDPSKGLGETRASSFYNGTSSSGNTLDGVTEGLHGLGFGTPINISASNSADAFESVPLDGSSDLQELKDDDTPPSLPLSARSRSFAHRLSLGNTANGLQSGSSSRRVSVSSVASNTSKSAGRSPLPRKVSAGLWGEVGTHSPAAEERRTNDPVLHLSIPANGTTKEGGDSSITKASGELREPASTSRRPSIIVDDPTPKVTATPRLQAPPAIPHDVNPALMSALSKPGASSLALAETGDPFFVRTPSSTTASHKRKSIFGLRTSSDLARSPATTEQSIVTPASSVRHSPHGSAQHVTGRSMLDQVRSQTRMVHLPPKSREEDEEHLERWKSMMEESRAAGSYCSCCFLVSRN